MLHAFILGAALMAGLLLAGRWYATADTKILLRVLKWVLLGGILSVVLFFIFTSTLILPVNERKISNRNSNK